MTQHDRDTVRTAARGQWMNIFFSLAGIAGEFLERRERSCPECGGNTRWRVYDDFDETGGCRCNDCGNWGDGFAFLEWRLQKPFNEIVNMVGEFLKCQPASNGSMIHQPVKPKPAKQHALTRKAYEPVDAGFMKHCEKNGKGRLDSLAGELGISVESLQALHVGYHPGWDVWIFPERSADGITIGRNRRFRDGAKRIMKDDRRGLYFADDWQQQPGPVLIVEGGSDTAAGIMLGLSVIGRPANIVPKELFPELVELLKGVPADRQILAVGENDQDLQHDDPRWPGKDGAIDTAKKLAEALGRPIPWALPPASVKDLRQWLKANPGKTGSDFLKELRPEETTIQEDASESARTFAGKSAAELWDLANEPVQWLVDGVFSCDQPTIFGAKQKSLKTTLLTDLAVSLASGLSWLGKFGIPQRRRVLFVTGEASEAAAIRKVRRAAECRNLRREDFTDCLRIEAITFPTLPSLADCIAVSSAVKEHGIEVVLLDPLYMGLQGLNTTNLTEVGPAMRQFMAHCRPANVIIAHHVKKTASFDDAPNLEDLSQAGIAEFAGNYWLMGRMAEYTGDGLHSLAVRYGGRDEQFGLLKLDFDERNWTAEFSSLMDHRVDLKARKETERVNAMTTKILTELKRYAEGISESKLATAVGTQRARGPFQTALAELEERGTIVCLSEFKPERSKVVTKGWALAPTV